MAGYCDQRTTKPVGHMLDESGFAAPGWPFEHDRHLTVRRDRKQTDLTTDLSIEWFPLDPIVSDVDFTCLLHCSVFLVYLAYMVYLFGAATINGTGLKIKQYGRNDAAKQAQEKRCWFINLPRFARVKHPTGTMLPQDAQKDRPARPQASRNRRRTLWG